MSIFEKISASLLVLVSIISFAAYGVWEDKFLFFSPLLLVSYAALALWVLSALLRSVKKGGAESRCLCIPPGGLWLLIFLIYSLVRIPTSVIPYDAKISCLRLGAYIGVYWASATIFSHWNQRRSVWGVLLVSLIGVALYSLVQHKVAPNMIFGMERYTAYWTERMGGRMGGTYQCPNHIAHLWQMWLPLCVLLLFVKRCGWFLRLCLAYSIPLFLLAIYQTQSRAGLLGTIASLCSVVLILLWRKSRKSFVLAIVIVPLLTAGCLGGLWFGSSMFRERMEPVQEVVQFAAQGDYDSMIEAAWRPKMWMDSLPLIRDHWLTGVGPGNYGMMIPQYRNYSSFRRTVIVHPHNEYLELIGEYGVVGTALVLCAILSIVIILLRWMKREKAAEKVFPAVALLAALVGTAVHGFFDFELRIFPNALMLALLGGCAVAPVLRSTRKRVEASPKRWGHVAVGTGLCVCMLGLFALSIPVCISSLMRVHADHLRASRDYDAADQWYERSTSLDAQNYWAWLGHGQVLSHQRYYELEPQAKRTLATEEQELYLMAYEANCKKEEILYGLGRAELQLGNQQIGLDHLRQAAEYKCFNDFYWRKLGIELRKAGLYDEALDCFNHADKLIYNSTVRANKKWLRQKIAAESGSSK